MPFSARHLGADLAIGRQTVGIAQHIVEHPVQFQLPRRVLVIALDHIEAHLAGIADDLHADTGRRLSNWSMW